MTGVRDQGIGRLDTLSINGESRNVRVLSSSTKIKAATPEVESDASRYYDIDIGHRSAKGPRSDRHAAKDSEPSWRAANVASYFLASGSLGDRPPIVGYTNFVRYVSHLREAMQQDEKRAKLGGGCGRNFQEVRKDKILAALIYWGTAGLAGKGCICDSDFFKCINASSWFRTLIRSVMLTFNKNPVALSWWQLISGFLDEEKQRKLLKVCTDWDDFVEKGKKFVWDKDDPGEAVRKAFAIAFRKWGWIGKDDAKIFKELPPNAFRKKLLSLMKKHDPAQCEEARKNNKGGGDGLLLGSLLEKVASAERKRVVKCFDELADYLESTDVYKVVYPSMARNAHRVDMARDDDNTQLVLGGDLYPCCFELGDREVMGNVFRGIAEGQGLLLQIIDDNGSDQGRWVFIARITDSGGRSQYFFQDTGYRRMWMGDLDHALNAVETALHECIENKCRAISYDISVLCEMDLAAAPSRYALTRAVSDDSCPVPEGDEECVKIYCGNLNEFAGKLASDKGAGTQMPSKNILAARDSAKVKSSKKGETGERRQKAKADVAVHEGSAANDLECSERVKQGAGKCFLAAFFSMLIAWCVCIALKLAKVLSCDRLSAGKKEIKEGEVDEEKESPSSACPAGNVEGLASARKEGLARGS